MGNNVWITSDSHFGHQSIIKFEDEAGKRLRPGFVSIDEHDKYLINCWNSVVKPNDRVYHLGDVAIARRNIRLMQACNGKKVLLRGNHDIFKLSDYAPYFEDIRAYKVYPKLGMILSHIPLHPNQLSSRFNFGVHGHTHSNDVTKPCHYREEMVPDERYLNVCVEKTNYTPISLDEILAIKEKRGL